MSVVLVILPLALAFVAVAVGAFVWAAGSGQFDDTETPPNRILVDDAGDRRRDAGTPPAPSAKA